MVAAAGRSTVDIDRRQLSNVAAAHPRGMIMALHLDERSRERSIQ
jgi:hypothetical protein